MFRKWVFTCRFPIHKMQGENSRFPRRIEVYITAKKFEQLSSLRWCFLFQKKCIKLDILHLSILSSFPVVGCAPESYTIIPIRARICDRRHVGNVNYLTGSFHEEHFYIFT